MNKPTGTHAISAVFSAVEQLQRDYDALRAQRDAVAPSTARYAVIERRLASMRRRATTLINALNPSDTAWKRAFGLL